MQLQHIVNHLNQLLGSEAIKDYCPNGLQIEGSDEVSRVMTAVTASTEAINQAINYKADMLLVHHGYFWKGEREAIIGPKKKRIEKLLKNNISLVAYHLPLDIHPEMGNNACLAKLMSIRECKSVSAGGTPNLLWYGEVGPMAVEGEVFGMRIAHALHREPLHIPSDRPIRQVAWCTGGAQDFIEQAAELGVDAYISGEISERTYHQARELGIHYYAAGHHASERYGVKALGDYLHRELSLEHQFYDEPNPV